MKDETIIHCPHAHACEWQEATEPEPDVGISGDPPGWYCPECGWWSSEYRNYAEYVEVMREERIESALEAMKYSKWH